MKISLIPVCAGLLSVVLGLPYCTADQQLKVSPSDELMVVPPSVDSRSRPTLNLVPAGGGLKQIEIPPTIIFHRYYYTGNREFQGPMLPGGPCVLVMNHPLTGQQITLKANLLPGAPRISYSRDGIRYNYGDRVICVTFPLLGHGEPVVGYKRHPAAFEATKNRVRRVSSTFSEFRDRVGFAGLKNQFRDRSRTVLLKSGDAINGLSNRATSGLDGLLQSTPFGSELTAPALPRPSTIRSPTGIVNELNGTVRSLP